jgi:hypothetical protein
MVPTMFANYFLASAGAGGALIGLLFVAVSIAPERTVAKGASQIRRATSASTFTALTNAFFISMNALLPNSNIGPLTVGFGLLGAINSASMAASVFRSGKSLQDYLRRALLITGSFVIYGFEVFNGAQLINSPHQVGYVYVISALVLTSYGLGLVRAWELLGAQRFGLLNWLSPLHEEAGNE